MTDEVIVVTASWLARYAEDGSRISDPGVSQGTLDRDATGEPDPEGNGNERSLVGFPLVLPAGSRVTQVWLQVPWTDWVYPTNVGELVLGWHHQATAPETWITGGGVGASDHAAREEAIDVALAWGNGAVVEPGFGGITVGPGHNGGGLYSGSTSAAPEDWTLIVRYSTDLQPESMRPARPAQPGEPQPGSGQLQEGGQ